GLDFGDGAGASESRLSTLVTLSSTPRASLIPGARQVIRLQLAGDLPERPGQTLFGNPTPGFAHWLMALDQMAKDDRVAGLLLQIDQAPNWAQSWELRQAIGRLKARGKKVVAILTVADMRSYYLAAIADEVHLYAAGGLLLSGLAITQTYWFSLMEKLGIKADLVRFADYKSATEPFTRTGPSEPAREQTRAILDGVHAEWLAAVTDGRGIPSQDLMPVLDMGPQTMKVALEKDLVDGLVEADALGALVERVFGADVTLARGYEPPKDGFARWANKRRVAIIPVVGGIVDGSSAGNLPVPVPFLGGETTGDNTFVAAVEAAAADPSVVGIVVRVDSGGGSAIASDKMHRAVLGAQKKKPLVVSFGNVAASGGYYLAAGSKILATPVTITGSIGIFAGKVDLAQLYAMIGLSTHTEKTNPRADMMSPFRPFTDEERAVATQTIRAYYDRFLGLVSEGRKLSLPDVERVAGGRVWLGTAALDNKLVDQLTGLWDAVAMVSREAGYEPDELSLTYLGGLPAFSSIQRLIGGAFFAEVDASAPKIHPELSALGLAFSLLSSDGPLAVEPTLFDIR
ncbi:MAG TPA: signal peptide peptidase SppA, partial [Myxococcota bacterium]|nr:signal peptide peptidase SppA [Myxococcota bacterium]